MSSNKGQRCLPDRGTSVDFMPYEGAQVVRDYVRQRTILAVALGAAMLIGAGVFAFARPAPRAGTEETRSAVRSRASVAEPADNAADNGNAGPGASESELAIHPVAAR